MIELPEARTIARDLRRTIAGKKILDVAGNYTDHKFTFYYGDPCAYGDFLRGERITGINDRNFYVEAQTETHTILMRDGANIRYYEPGAEKPAKSKFMLLFEDDSFLNVTTTMYAFICVFETAAGMEDTYYEMECAAIGPMDDAFTWPYFKSLLDEKTSKLSAKAFLATEQRIPGVGNGVTQDILFNAKIMPKRKMNTLSVAELNGLYESAVKTLHQMTAEGGRDTEADIYGRKGGYRTKLCAATYKDGCPVCGGAINKEQYLGGSVYYCPVCQK